MARPTLAAQSYGQPCPDLLRVFFLSFSALASVRQIPRAPVYSPLAPHPNKFLQDVHTQWHARSEHHAQLAKMSFNEILNHTDKVRECVFL